MLFALLELLNNKIRRPAELEQRLGITALATLPYMETRTHRLMRRSLKVASLLVVVIGIPAILWAIDTYYLPLDLVYQRVLGRIGLS